MSRKPRIPTDGAPPLSTNPFAALQAALGNLPPGEAAPAPATAEPEPELAPIPSPSLAHGKLILRREKKGRGGKDSSCQSPRYKTWRNSSAVTSAAAPMSRERPSC